MNHPHRAHCWSNMRPSYHVEGYNMESEPGIKERSRHSAGEHETDATPTRRDYVTSVLSTALSMLQMRLGTF